MNRERVCPKLDPATHDMVMDQNGDFIMAQGKEATAQCITNTLLAWKKEWFLNLDHGTDYKKIFNARSSVISDEEIREVLREAVFQEKEVQRIDEINLNREGRDLEITVTAVLTDGSTITAGTILK